MSVAGVVVNDAGQILVIQRRDNGHWEAPGGVLGRDETFEHGVAREVAEETGIQVEVERLTGVYKNMPNAIVALVYRCHPTAGSPRQSAESSAVCWVDRDKIANLMKPAYAVRVLDALQDHPASRAHDGHQVITSPA